jgi:hypothetical protein
VNRTVTSARASGELSSEVRPQKSNVKKLLDQARETQVDLEQLDGGRPVDVVDLQERIRSVPTNAEQAELAYRHLTSFASSPQGDRLTPAAKRALIEGVVRPSGPTDAGQIGLLTAADVQNACVALENLTDAEYSRLAPLLSGRALKDALFLAALGARAHLFTARGREVDRKIAGVFDGGLEQSPLAHELDALEKFGLALRSSELSDDELAKSQTLLHFGRGPWEPNGIDDLFERHRALRDAGAVWISYASGCLPAALTLLTTDPVRREQLHASIANSEWLPQGLYADQVKQVLEEQNGRALPYLAQQLEGCVAWRADGLERDGKIEDARELRALAAGEKKIPTDVEQKYGDLFSDVPMPIRDLLELVRSQRGNEAGDGINEYRAKDAARVLLPLQEIEAWHLRGVDPSVLRRELEAHFAKPNAGPYFIQPAVQEADGFLTYVTLEVTAYDTATGRMRIGGDDVPVERELDPEIVKLHALERSLPEFVRAFNVTFDFDPTLDAFIDALVQGHGTVLHIVDTADVGSGGSGHWMAVLRTRPGEDGTREFLVCDPRARYFLDWVREPAVRDRSFLRAFTGYAQPMISSVLVSRS